MITVWDSGSGVGLHSQRRIVASRGPRAAGWGGQRLLSPTGGGERRRFAMRAVVFHGPGQKHWEEVPDPKIVDDGDAIVRITSTTICGTDLHILKGDVPAMTPGQVLNARPWARSPRSDREGAWSSRVITCCCRASRPAADAALAGAQVRALHWWRWLDPWPPDRRGAGRIRRSPSPIPRPTRSPKGLHRRCSTSQHPHRLWGRHAQRPGQPDTVAIVGAAPVGLAAILGRGCAHRRSWRSTPRLPGATGPSSSAPTWSRPPRVLAARSTG